MSSSMPASGNRGEARSEQLKTNLTAEEARQLALPVSETPGLSVDKTAAQNMAIGSENFNGELGAPRGVNTERLFATRASSNDERFERLEAAMQKMRDDFDAVNPSINRLISIEREIQTLVDQLQVLVDADAASAPVPPVSEASLEAPVSAEFPADPNAALGAPIPLAPPPAPVTEPVADAAPMPAPTPAVAAPAPTPSAPSSSHALANVRVADHANTTRIVFETTEKLSYTATVDPEKILIVTFANGSAGANIAAAKTNSKLVKSIDQTPQGSGGVIVAMPLNKMSKIVKQGVLKPEASNPYYRIYIDLEL